MSSIKESGFTLIIAAVRVNDCIRLYKTNVNFRGLQCGTYVNFQGLARVAIQGLTWVNFQNLAETRVKFRFLAYPVNSGRPEWW